jgi:hypothetical protein
MRNGKEKGEEMEISKDSTIEIELLKALETLYKISGESLCFSLCNNSGMLRSEWQLCTLHGHLGWLAFRRDAL